MSTLTQTATVADVLADLDRDGYSIVPGVLTSDEAEAIRQELTAIADTIPHGRTAFVGRHTPDSRQPPLDRPPARREHRGHDRRDAGRVGVVLPRHALARRRCQPQRSAPPRRRAGVRGRMAAAPGEPHPRRAPGHRARTPRASPRTARLQRVPAVPGLRRRAPPPAAAPGLNAKPRGVQLTPVP